MNNFTCPDDIRDTVLYEKAETDINDKGVYTF